MSESLVTREVPEDSGLLSVANQCQGPLLFMAFFVRFYLFIFLDIFLEDKKIGVKPRVHKSRRERERW